MLFSLLLLLLFPPPSISSMHRLLFSLSRVFLVGQIFKILPPSLLYPSFLHQYFTAFALDYFHLLHTLSIFSSAWQFGTLHSHLSSLNVRTSSGTLCSLLLLLSSSLSSLPSCAFLCSHHLLPHPTVSSLLSSPLPPVVLPCFTTTSLGLLFPSFPMRHPATPLQCL